MMKKFLVTSAAFALAAGVGLSAAWADVPEDWVCPICGAGKDDFEKEE